MLSAEFQKRIDEALGIICDRQRLAWLSFGRKDFPQDGGLSFRNEFIKFALGFKSELNNSVGDDAKHDALLERLTPHQIVRVIGVLHFFITTWGACRGWIRPSDFHKALDWILNTYAFPSSAAVEWCDLAKRNTDRYGLPEGEQKIHYEIAAILGTSPSDSPSSKFWGGFAFVTSHGLKWDDAAHAERCRQIFES